MLIKQCVMISYSMFIVYNDQQPATACQGLGNLLQSSFNMAVCQVHKLHSLYCDTVLCNTSDWRLELFLQHCYEYGRLTVEDKTRNNTTFINFTSNFTIQTLNHMLGNTTGNITLTSAIGHSTQSSYYLIALQAPLFNLTYPETAIPIQCSRKNRSILSIKEIA